MTTSFHEALQKQGLRATVQRLELLRILSTAGGPKSISELRLIPTKSAMDTTTLYRGLETLITAGLVRKVNLGHSHNDYELIDENKHHHHLVCKGCSTIEDISWCPKKNLEEKILQGSDFMKITDHSIEFFGFCKKCVK